MSIIDACDLIGKPVLTPNRIYPNVDKYETCIVTFSHSVYEKVINDHPHKIIAKTNTANGDIDIFLLKEYGVLFYMSPIGSAVAATILQEVNHIAGANNFIFFGSCGLIDEKAKDKIIIPDRAYRDEGLSYHYLEASDYIEIKNHQHIEKILTENDIPNITGMTWTTDAIYMETDNKVKRHKEDGCLCVEMEASGLQAVCDYLNINLYIFFFSGDILKEEWDQADLGGEREKSKQLNCFDLAILISQNI